MARPVKATVERELKLGAPASFRLPDLPGEPIEPRVLVSTYYDTPDHRLAAGGVTLRRRVEPAGTSWQLKLPRGIARIELELASASRTAPVEILDLLVARLRGAPVEPVATLRTRRSGVRVRGIEGPIADVTVDLVSVMDGRRVARRFTEIEAELLGGDEAALATIGRALEAAGALPGDSRPKLFQALDLEAADATVPPEDGTIADHLRHLIRSQVALIVRHDPGTRLGADIEELHQMRVATRRLRGLLRAARPLLDPEWAESLRAELGWLGGALGPVRDLDVLLEHLTGESDLLEPAEQRAFLRLLTRLEGEREEARALMLDALRAPRYVALLDRLDRAADEMPIVESEETLETIARAEYRRLRRDVGRLPEDPIDDELHALRIRGKRARYAAEFAAGTMSPGPERLIRELKAFQDVLGEHQDACIAEERLRALVARGAGVRAAFAAGRLVQHQRERRVRARATYEDVWERARKQGRALWR
ncbi:MAG: CYTH and CHAD domain-containing protein [Thermoleophilia bacterium]